MKNKVFIFFVISLLLLTSCQKDLDIRSDEADEPLVVTRALADEFVKAYTQKDGLKMNDLASDRYSFNKEIFEENQNGTIVYMNILGQDLDYECIEAKAYKSYTYFEYALNEKLATGAIDAFKLKLKFRQFEEDWLMDSIFVEFD